MCTHSFYTRTWTAYTYTPQVPVQSKACAAVLHATTYVCVCAYIHRYVALTPRPYLADDQPKRALRPQRPVAGLRHKKLACVLRGCTHGESRVNARGTAAQQQPQARRGKESTKMRLAIFAVAGLTKALGEPPTRQLATIRRSAEQKKKSTASRSPCGAAGTQATRRSMPAAPSRHPGTPFPACLGALTLSPHLPPLLWRVSCV